MAGRKQTSEETWKKGGDPHEELLSLAKDLEGDEVRVLVRIARRLWVGRQRYGKLKLLKDGRKLLREAVEELLDFLVYSECHEERKAQRKARRKTA